MADLPRLILWAWERPEQLGFIDPEKAGVAYLALTLQLKGDEVVARPRLQPLEVAPGTCVIVVTRIETDRSASLSSRQCYEATAAIARLARNNPLRAIQIDFDARQSEREFYRELLIELRKELPPAMKLSITALASWCIGDPWIEGLPIDEAVPMLFRMGPDKETVEQRLKSGLDFQVPASRQSLGISTDEPIENLPAGRRIYVFNPKPWTVESFEQIIREVNSLR